MRFLFAVLGTIAIAAAQKGQIQKPRDIWQKPGEIQKPGDIQVPKGIQAIKVQEQNCKQLVTVGSDALFEFDKWTLTADAEQTLTALGPVIQKAGKHTMHVEGHTDGVGSEAYNQTLSEKRAETVKEWLVAHGYAPASTPVHGFGKLRPVAPNTNPDGSDNPKGRQENRRVEVIIDSCN